MLMLHNRKPKCDALSLIFSPIATGTTFYNLLQCTRASELIFSTRTGDIIYLDYSKNNNNND